MNFTNITCFDKPDPYIITTSFYYVILGLLGILVNNSFINDINSLIFITGVCYIIEFSSTTTELIHIPLIICANNICYKFLSELIKSMSNSTGVDHDVLTGIKGSRKYRIPVSMLAILMTGCTVLLIKYYNLYILIGIIFLSQFIVCCSTILFYPSGTIHYKITRLMIIRLVIATILGCIGLGTSQICPNNTWIWLRLFIGHPISSFCISYTFYTSAQLLLLLRGKNLRRKTAISGERYIFVAYYVGRDIPHLP